MYNNPRTCVAMEILFVHAAHSKRLTKKGVEILFSKIHISFFRILDNPYSIFVLYDAAPYYCIEISLRIMCYVIDNWPCETDDYRRYTCKS